MKRIVVLMIMVVIIAGCSTSEKTTACTMNLGEEEEIKTLITLTSNDDKVVKIVTENTVDLKKTSSYIEASELEDYGKGLSETYSAIKGVSYSYQLDKSEFKEILEIAITDKNFETLKNGGLLSGYVDGDDKEVSLKLVKNYLETREMKCK